ncbi:ribosome maturation factor RimM [Candidatus Annandia pinicola]|uniref:ribosome maturation factor RimM n=1 Tax=Candidatus Annandia pinicola TaxID=1345117 RepID=UPI001D010609|nr:ribosome maturation factor RimM [Candidatus Annandia pinicola]UDG80429.1 Ribosome maturation factor RimM [Candidatus Annandia pinicola]
MLIKNYTIIGKLRKFYGIKKYLILLTFTEIKKKIFNYIPWYVSLYNKVIFLYINNWNYKNKKFLVKINNIDNIKNLSFLINNKIIIHNIQFKKTFKNEFYYYNIIHFKVYNLKLFYLGKIINIFENYKNFINIILLNKKKKILYISFIDKNIFYISLQQKKIILNINKYL